MNTTPNAASDAASHRRRAPASLKPLYLDLHAVCEIVNLAPATLQDMVRQDEFPKPRKLSARRVGWLVREVEEWAEQRPISDLLPPPNTGSRHRKTKSAAGGELLEALSHAG